MNVKFYKLESLPNGEYSSSYQGYFVWVTTGEKPGLYFGGNSSWEYLTNDADEIDSKIDTAIAALDGTATISSVSDGVVTLKKGIVEVDGVIDNNTESDITLAKVATTGAAVDISYDGISGDSESEPNNVEAALDDLYGKVRQAISAAGVTSLSGDNTYISTNASTGAVTVSHITRTETTNTSEGTVGAGNTGTTDTFTVPTYTFDGAGHETAVDTKTITVTFPSAGDLGLSSAMHFKGTESTLPTPTTSDNYENGDVILVGTKEYVRSGKTDSEAGSWVELGDEGSHALKTIEITGAGVLSGGGTLEANRTITHNAITTPSSGTDTSKSQGDSVTVMTGITGDGHGHVTGYTTNTFTIPTVPTVNDATLTISDGTNTSEIFSANKATNSTLTITGSDNIIATVSNGTITISHSLNAGNLPFSDSHFQAQTTKGAIIELYDKFEIGATEVVADNPSTSNVEVTVIGATDSDSEGTVYSVSADLVWIEGGLS